MILESNVDPRSVAWNRVVQLLAQTKCALEQTQHITNEVSERRDTCEEVLEGSRTLNSLCEAMETLQHQAFMAEVGLIRVASLLRVLAFDEAEPSEKKSVGAL